MNQVEKDLNPLFVTSEVNEPILVGKEKIEFELDGETYAAPAEIWTRFLPYPQLTIETQPSLSPARLVRIRDVKQVHFPARGLSIDVIVVRSGTTGTVMLSRHTPVVATDEGNGEILSVVFHLVNFTNFYSEKTEELEESGSSYRRDYVVLASHGWKISLFVIPQTRNNFESLRHTGGYAVTHVGRLERESGECFSSIDARDIMTALHNFFSLARGLWCGVLLPVGFGSNGETFWAEWGITKCDPWEYTPGWFDPMRGALLEEVFPGFMALWGSDVWGKPLGEALYWYVHSNKSSHGADSGIILGQAALELLAYVYAVEDRGLIGREGFSKLPASDKLRLLLASLNIPLGIPPELEELAALGKKLNWGTGAEAFTAVRNELVHPEHKKRGQFGDVYYETWDLGQWYLDLVFMRLCKHVGLYGNRLKRRWAGEVESVPWAREISSNHDQTH